MIVNKNIKIFSAFLLVNLILWGCNSNLKKEVIEKFDDGSPKKESFYTLTEKNRRVVKEIQYYESGQKKYIGHFKNGKKDGKWVFWFENGNKWSEGYFIEGLRTSKAFVYHENGNIFYKGEYLAGKKDGNWTFYNIDGEKVNVVTFDNGVIVSQTNPNIKTIE